MIVAAILLFAVAIAIIYYLQSDKVDSKQSEEEQQAEGLAFPYELEDGKISVDSIFQFTGFNPDNENVEGENIAALTVVNQSEQHLASAQFTVKLADGAQLAFEITDLPAGQKAMIFEKENQVYELDDVCEEITDTAEFEDSSPVMADRLSAEVQETAVTLTNNSEEDLTDLLLHCHCVIDDAYFGGLTYTYSIESIPAGQSASVDAVDCYLGQAAAEGVLPEGYELTGEASDVEVAYGESETVELQTEEAAEEVPDDDADDNGGSFFDKIGNAVKNVVDTVVNAVTGFFGSLFRW